MNREKRFLFTQREGENNNLSFAPSVKFLDAQFQRIQYVVFYGSQLDRALMLRF